MLGIVTSARLDVLILSVVLAPSPIQKSSGRGTGAWQGERFSHHGRRVVPTRYGWDSEALAQRVCPWSRAPSERDTHRGASEIWPSLDRVHQTAWVAWSMGAATE